MTKVSVNKTINVSANEAWEKLSSFRGIEEYSPIARSETKGEGEGATRTCYMPDGAAIHEVLNKVDASSMHFQYEITEGPFPISSYISDVVVKPVSSSSCEITWSCIFTSDAEVEGEMSQLFEGFYHVIIDSLEQVLQN